MRNITILTFALLYVGAANAQFNTYHPFPDSNAGWRETDWSMYMCSSSSSTNVLTESDYYVRGDTMVNGKKYIKLNSSGGYRHESGVCPPVDTVWQCYNSLYCLLREDTAARKLYASFAPSLGVNDTLLYDFNLQVGDTLPQTYINKAGRVYVGSIDSILVGSTYRKQFIIAYDTGSLKHIVDSIIEGIGSAQGLLEGIVSIPPGSEVGYMQDCFIDSSITFLYNRYSNCDMFYTCPLSGIATIQQPGVSIYVFPNPSSNGVFTVAIKNGAALTSSNTNNSPTSNYELGIKNTVEVYNVLGEKVFSSFTINHSPFTINISSQPAGIYLYRVLTGSGELVGKGKLVIQK